MSHERAHYIPAAGHDLFLPFYDPVVRLLTRERVFRSQFLVQADIRPGHRVLDVGCGTGTMAVLIRQQQPESIVVGVDGDPRALAVARRKAERAGQTIEFEESFADRLPYSDRSFDRVLSSLVFHHLTHDDKLAAMREIRRVLKPDGWFHLADFGPPVGWYSTLLTRLVKPGERLRENLDGHLPALMTEAGFTTVQQRGHHNMLFGTFAFCAASADPA